MVCHVAHLREASADQLPVQLLSVDVVLSLWRGQRNRYRSFISLCAVISLYHVISPTL